MAGTGKRGKRAPVNRETVEHILNQSFANLLCPARKELQRKAPMKTGAAKLLWDAGIFGFGYGVKETAGSLTPILGARVYVRGKKSLRSLDNALRIPELILDDVNTDVIAAGRVKLFNGDSDIGTHAGTSTWLTKDLAMLRSPQRPPNGGCSVGPKLNAGDMAGSIGCFVKDSPGQDSPGNDSPENESPGNDSIERVYILSNNHVLANSRLTGFDNEIEDGAPIFQPGTLDRSDRYINKLLKFGMEQDDSVAELTRVIPIKPSDPTNVGAPKENRIDAAIAEITLPADCPKTGSPVYALPLVDPPLNGADLEDLLVKLSPPPSPYTPKDLLLTTVGKVGRTTGATLGVVVDVAARLWIPYGGEQEWDKYAWFVDQIAVVPVGSQPLFSDSGDSGSAVFDARTNEIIGLLFAGSSDGHTFVNPIDAVFSELGVTLLA